MATRPYPEVDHMIEKARTVILPRFGASLRLLPGPLCAAVQACLVASESGGYRWKTTKPQGERRGPKFREAGLTMRTTYRRPKRGDCERQNFDPFDPLSNLWGAQAMFAAQAIPMVRAVQNGGWTKRNGRNGKVRLYQIGDIPPADWQMLLYLCHSIGARGTRRAVERAGRAILFGTEKTGAQSATPGAALNIWIDTAAALRLKWGAQPIDLVRHRVHRALQLVDRAGEVGIGFPTANTVDAPPRPAGVLPCPRNLYDRLDQLAAIAKAQGNAATGPW
jgi:hypothetical protein